MSNEVNKDAENKEETPKSVEEQTNKTETAEASAEEKEVATINEEAKASTETPAVETKETAENKVSDDKQESDDMDFGAILEQFEQEQVTFHAGELVKGKVVGISDQGALVDFGYKSEGTVASEEYTNDEGEVTLKEGDDIEVVIKSMGAGDNPPSLSRFDAARRRSWNEIEKVFNDNETIKAKVTSKTKGGLKVDVNGVEAFLPGSQIDSRPVRNLDAYIGEEIEAKVIKFSRKRNNIVLSRKVITDEVINAQKAETLKDIEQGYIVEGTVKNLTDYGAFVDIGGIDGLLHVTDMSWGRLHNPNELFKVGDHVQVKILKLDRDREKVSLGFKQLLPDPWSTVTELYPVNKKIQGKISSVTEYGAFVELEPGVEGLVHVTEMSWSKRMKHPKHLVKRGDEVEVQVLGIDPDERRISLGIKQLQENPWDTIIERFQVGSQVKGQVRNLTDFGAFVEIEEGVDGLVHVSDISWSKKIKHPKDVLKKGQEVEAVITNMDIEGRRLSLSIKELTPSAWDQFTNEHKSGDAVKGKISRFASFGVFVELAPDLEGLCHISELSDDRIENPEDQFKVGQELDFKILRIEHDVEKIGLSHRAVGREDEIGGSGESKSYSSQAKGGMASLGELANLRFGSGEEESSETKVEDSIAEETEEVNADTIDVEKVEEENKEADVELVAEETKAEEENKEEASDKDASSETSEEAKSEDQTDEAKAEEPNTETSEATETSSDGKEVEVAEEKKEVIAEDKVEDEAKAESKDEAEDSNSKDEVKAETSEDDSSKDEKSKEKGAES